MCSATVMVWHAVITPIGFTAFALSTTRFTEKNADTALTCYITVATDRFKLTDVTEAHQ